MVSSAESRSGLSPLRSTESQDLSRASDVSAVGLLRRIAIRFSEAAPIDGVLADVVEFVAAVATCNSCFIYVLGDEGLVLRASKNPHPEVVRRLKIRIGQGITGWVAEHR